MTLEITELDYELILLLLKLGALLPDHIHKKLVLQTLRGDGKVDNGYLDANLRQVVRIWQLRGHQELEVPRVGHWVST